MMAIIHAFSYNVVAVGESNQLVTPHALFVGCYNFESAASSSPGLTDRLVVDILHQRNGSLSHFHGNENANPMKSVPISEPSTYIMFAIIALQTPHISSSMPSTLFIRLSPRKLVVYIRLEITCA